LGVPGWVAGALLHSLDVVRPLQALAQEVGGSRSDEVVAFDDPVRPWKAGVDELALAAFAVDDDEAAVGEQQLKVGLRALAADLHSVADAVAVGHLSACLLGAFVDVAGVDG